MLMPLLQLVPLSESFLQTTSEGGITRGRTSENTDFQKTAPQSEILSLRH